MFILCKDCVTSVKPSLQNLSLWGERGILSLVKNQQAGRWALNGNHWIRECQTGGRNVDGTWFIFSLINSPTYSRDIYCAPYMCQDLGQAKCKRAVDSWSLLSVPGTQKPREQRCPQPHRVLLLLWGVQHRACFLKVGISVTGDISRMESQKEASSFLGCLRASNVKEERLL